MNQKFPRRTSLSQPGEGLLLAANAIDIIQREQMWAELTGLSPEDIFFNQLLAVPAPMYRPFNDGERRWVGTRPEAMWHPLMWLPQSLATRYMMADGSVESDNVWALRVAYTLTRSGIFDEETGTWLDVLALAGLPIEDPHTVDRVQAWLDGASDEVLDAINLDDLIGVPEGSEHGEQWAVVAALESENTMLELSWGLLSADLLALVSSTDVDNGSAADVKHAVDVVSSLAENLLAVDGEISAEQWRSLRERLETTDVADVQEIANLHMTAIGLILGVHETFYPAVLEWAGTSE